MLLKLHSTQAQQDFYNLGALVVSQTFYTAQHTEKAVTDGNAT